MTTSVIYPRYLSEMDISAIELSKRFYRADQPDDLTEEETALLSMISYDICDASSDEVEEIRNFIETSAIEPYRKAQLLRYLEEADLVAIQEEEFIRIVMHFMMKYVNQKGRLGLYVNGVSDLEYGLIFDLAKELIDLSDCLPRMDSKAPKSHRFLPGASFPSLIDLSKARKKVSPNAAAGIFGVSVSEKSAHELELFTARADIEGIERVISSGLLDELIQTYHVAISNRLDSIRIVRYDYLPGSVFLLYSTKDGRHTYSLPIRHERSQESYRKNRRE